MHASEFHDYLMAPRAIATCLEQHRSLGYLASPRTLWVDEHFENRSIIAQARAQNIPVRTSRPPHPHLPEAAAQDLKRHHALLTITVTAPSYAELDWSEMRTVLILDHLTDIQNLGAILRSASVFGVDAVIYPKHEQARLNPRVRSIAQGGAERVPCIAVNSINQTILHARSQGFWTYGFSEHAQHAMHTQSFSDRVLLIVGSEDAGVRKRTLELCDFLLNIPSAADFNCLNAASATSIILYERHRQHSIQA